MRVSKNFMLQEFMHPTVYKLIGNLSKRIMDQRIFDIAQQVREDLGRPVHINNWHRDGRFKNRGFRLPFSTVGAWKSEHKKGNAFDFHINGIPPREVVAFIMKNEQKYYDLGVRRIEDPEYTPSWIHLDCKETGLNKVKIFRP